MIPYNRRTPRYSVHMTSVSNVFGPRGLLAQNLPGFTYRHSQEKMAHAIHGALAQSEHLAIEAGTGIGKTFGYLVPVLMSGQRGIISTGTLTLQDQLFSRDLPLISSAIGRPVSVVLLKGRRNYLCWHRLKIAKHGGDRDDSLLSQFSLVEEWGRKTATGDLTEIESTATSEKGIRSWISSSSDNCLGNHCEFFDECFLLKARRSAQSADVVIVNHHLLLADLALKDSGFGEILPGTDVVVVDEAHQLPDIAQQFFGISIGSRELEYLARDIISEVRAAGMQGTGEKVCNNLLGIVSSTRSLCGESTGRNSWDESPSHLKQNLDSWKVALQDVRHVIDPVGDVNSGIRRCVERCQDALERLHEIQSSVREGLKWIEVSQSNITIHWTPLNIGAELGMRISSQKGSWVFTSATLAVGGSFDHFLDRVGVPTAETKILSSPFDYQSNARMFLPEGLPQPSSSDYTVVLLSTIWPIIKTIDGGVFLLFTSYRSLSQAKKWLSKKKLPGPMLVQGEKSRTKILEEFRLSGNALLLGTSSFWHGVDVRGQSLRLVLIDKLPFASPADPIMQGRLNIIRQDGRDPFSEFQLPQAVLSLKQGVGRLIRDFSDRGIIIIGDPRLKTRAYGQVFLESLPPIPIIDNHEDLLEFANSLKFSSTTKI